MDKDRLDIGEPKSTDALKDVVELLRREVTEELVLERCQDIFTEAAAMCKQRLQAIAEEKRLEASLGAEKMHAVMATVAEVKGHEPLPPLAREGINRFRESLQLEPLPPPSEDDMKEIAATIESLSGPVHKKNKSNRYDWPALAKKFLDEGYKFTNRGDPAKFMRANGIPLGTFRQLKEAVENHILTFTAEPSKAVSKIQALGASLAGKRPFGQEINGVFVRFVEAFPPGDIPAHQKRCYNCIATIDKAELLTRCPKCGGPLRSKALNLA